MVLWFKCHIIIINIVILWFKYVLYIMWFKHLSPDLAPKLQSYVSNSLDNICTWISDFTFPQLSS